MTKADVIAQLPPYKGNEFLRVEDQDTKDIIAWLLKVTPKYAKDYDLIYQDFDTGDLYSTCKGLWRFLKYSCTYNAESREDQTVRSPAAILQLPNVDCKHYSLFIGGVLDAIRRQTGDKFTWNYRLASYNGDPTPGHVFVVAKDKENGEIWIDPCLARFDEKKRPSYYYDKKGSSISGVLGCDCLGGVFTQYPALLIIAGKIIYDEYVI